MDPFATNASDDEDGHDYSYSPAEPVDPSFAQSFPPAATQSTAGRIQSEITVMDSLKVSDGLGGQYIAYTIQIGNKPETVQRRYSEFESVRKILQRLYPQCIIPPIPGKHSLAAYAKKQSKAKDDPQIIELRKRMLQRFLNRVASHPQLGSEQLFQRFLEPGAWADVLFSQKISKKPLVGGKSAPSTSSKRLKNPDLKFLELEHSNDKLSMRSETAKKDTKRIVKRFGELSAVYAELGMVFNAFSLHETGHEHLARGIEKLGQAMDSAHLTTNSFVRELEQTFGDDCQELYQFTKVVEDVLKLRNQKHFYYEDLGAQIDAKRIYLAGLEKDPAIANSVKQEQQQGTSSGGSVGLGRLVKNSLQSLGDKIHQVIDSDPEATRRSQIAKTRDQILQLEKSRDEAHAELGRFSELVSREMDRFREQKDRDLSELPCSFARVYAQWLRKNIAAFEGALVTIENIQ